MGKEDDTLYGDSDGIDLLFTKQWDNTCACEILAMWVVWKVS